MQTLSVSPQIGTPAPIIQQPDVAQQRGFKKSVISFIGQ